MFKTKSPYTPQGKMSWSSYAFTWLFSIFPAYRGTGARVDYIAGDWKEILIRLPLNWRNRNYVGTIFGGAMFGATDPMYMIQFLKVLGDDYIVWDKAAEIQFRRPGKSCLFARFAINDEHITMVKKALETEDSYDMTLEVELVDCHNKVYALVNKTLYFSTKKAYEAKLARRKKASKK